LALQALASWPIDGRTRQRSASPDPRSIRVELRESPLGGFFFCGPHPIGSSVNPLFFWCGRTPFRRDLSRWSITATRPVSPTTWCDVPFVVVVHLYSIQRPEQLTPKLTIFRRRLSRTTTGS
jgi:hypothetical protein